MRRGREKRLHKACHERQLPHQAEICAKISQIRRTGCGKPATQQTPKVSHEIEARQNPAQIRPVHPAGWRSDPATWILQRLGASCRFTNCPIATPDHSVYYQSGSDPLVFMTRTNTTSARTSSTVFAIVRRMAWLWQRPASPLEQRSTDSRRRAGGSHQRQGMTRCRESRPTRGLPRCVQ